MDWSRLWRHVTPIQIINLDGVSLNGSLVTNGLNGIYPSTGSMMATCQYECGSSGQRGWTTGGTLMVR